MRGALGTFAAVVIACGSGSAFHAPDGGSDAAALADAAPPDASNGCAVTDADGDGFDAITCGGADCNDADPDVHPGAVDPTAWEITRVDDDGSAPSLAAGPDGSVHLVYATPMGLRYATDANGWAPETIDATSTTGPAVIVGPDGVVRVAYIEMLEWPGSNLEYAVRTDDGWTIETVAPGAEWTWPSAAAITLDSHAQVHVAFETREPDRSFTLRHATRAADGWLVEDIADYDQWGTLPSIAAADAAIHVAAMEPGGRDLLHFTRGLGDWTSEIIASDVSYDATVISNSMIFSSGELRVAYPNNGDIAVAVWSQGTWAPEVVDASPVQPIGPVLASDPAGGLHLAFLGAEWGFEQSIDWSVRYASQSDGDWTVEIVADLFADLSDDRVGFAIDTSGVPHIGYRADGMYHAIRNRPSDGIDQDCDGNDG